jgi:hypothetical protein
MNRVAHAFKRTICCIKGHKPFPPHDILETPPEKQDWTLSSLGVTTAHLTAGMGLASNSSWGAINGNSLQEHGVTFSNGPVNVSAKICSRCHGIYWNSSIKGSYFTSVKAVPELAAFYKWQTRQVWEAKQRGKNPMAEKLYNQYQVALKIAYDGDDNEATA